MGEFQNSFGNGAAARLGEMENPFGNGGATPMSVGENEPPFAVEQPPPYLKLEIHKEATEEMFNINLDNLRMFTA